MYVYNDRSYLWCGGIEPQNEARHTKKYVESATASIPIRTSLVKELGATRNHAIAFSYRVFRRENQ